jgi:hypothetical protein
VGVVTLRCGKILFVWKLGKGILLITHLFLPLHNASFQRRFLITNTQITIDLNVEYIFER